MYDISTKVVMRTHALCIPTRPYNLGFQKHLQTLRLTQKVKKKVVFFLNFCIAECSFAFDEIIVSVSHYIYPKKKDNFKITFTADMSLKISIFQ